MLGKCLKCVQQYEHTPSTSNSMLTCLFYIQIFLVSLPFHTYREHQFSLCYSHLVFVFTSTNLSPCPLSLILSHTRLYIPLSSIRPLSHFHSPLSLSLFSSPISHFFIILISPLSLYFFLSLFSLIPSSILPYSKFLLSASLSFIYFPFPSYAHFFDPFSVLLLSYLRLISSLFFPLLLSFLALPVSLTYLLLIY